MSHFVGFIAGVLLLGLATTNRPDTFLFGALIGAALMNFIVGTVIMVRNLKERRS
jgi:hypothetical protein